MTRKSHKVFTNTWEAPMWLDTKLEKLIYQATHVPQGDHRFQTTTYVVSTPIPPWMASGKENYGMVETVTRRRFSKEIAEEMLNVHGEFAHMRALEELELRANRDESLWKDVLIWLDELTGEKK